MSDPPIRYAGTTTSVELGDQISTRVFFVRRRATVVYVPGVSKMLRSLERDGLQWVGLRESRGPFLAALVDPKTRELDKRISFVARGEKTGPLAGDPFTEPGDIEGPAEESRE